MIELFSTEKAIGICLKNNNPYVKLAVKDLRRDFARVSTSRIQPDILTEESDCCIIIEENCMEDSAAIENESYSIRTEGSRIIIAADSYLGTMWGIYTFSSAILGVDPCYLFNDLEPEMHASMEISAVSITDRPASAGFRGVFINDEDLLTGWKDGGGIRYMNYPWYGLTVPAKVMDLVVETVLRLRMNLIIPASFLDIDNPPEKALADAAAGRGIYISQHHAEPLGLSHFALENYCKKFSKSGEYSYIRNPELLEEAWKYYAAKWAEYDNVVWQIGLRGKADRPMWEEAIPGEEELQKYGEFISGAMRHQKAIVREATHGKARYFTSTLWMEGSKLMEKGYLSLDEDVISIFADTGTNQMYGAEYYQIPRSNRLQYGIYYHLQYHHEGPHLAPQTGIDKLYFNLNTAIRQGDNAYFIINVSNVREFVFELHACAEMLWNIEAFSKEEYMNRYCAVFGDSAAEMRDIINRYYSSLPELDVSFLKKDLPKYFNYDYTNRDSTVKNFVLKEGNILTHGREIISAFHAPLRDNLYPEYYTELVKAVPQYEEIVNSLTEISHSLPDRIKKHIACKWLLYAKTLLCIYRWYVCLYDAKRFCDRMDSVHMISSLQNACSSLEEYIRYRTCAEYGEFSDWFRGDTKMNVKQCLMDTCKLLGQVPAFS